MMRSRPRQISLAKRRAFTLVEILMVLMILGIAAAMIAPRLGSMGDIQVSSAARTLVANMEYAQNEAIVTQQDMTVEFNESFEKYWLADAAGNLLTHPVTKRDFTVEFPNERGLQKVEVLSADFGGNDKVTFDSLGSPSNGGSVMLGADGHTYRVDVAPVTGRIQVVAINP